jgi:adenylate cyclase, class 2
MSPTVKRVLARVDKTREIYFIENVKFHLDDVVNLGTFIEIEAIDLDGTIGNATLHEQCERYISLFGIRDSDLVSHSYSDMRLKRTKTLNRPVSPGPRAPDQPGVCLR